MDDLDDDDSVSSSPRRNAAADEGERQNEVEEHDQGPITVDADYDGDGDGDGDLIVASHSERVKSGSNGDTRPELVVHRPALSTFRKPGFPKDLLRWLKEFPHALLLVRVGQFYEVCLHGSKEISQMDDLLSNIEQLYDARLIPHSNAYIHGSLASPTLIKQSRLQTCSRSD